MAKHLASRHKFHDHVEVRVILSNNISLGAIRIFFFLSFLYEMGFLENIGHLNPHLEVELQTDKKWERYRLQNTFLVQRMLNLFQLDNLKRGERRGKKRLTISLYYFKDS